MSYRFTSVIGVILLVVAMFDAPSSYYLLLRWVICPVAIHGGVILWRRQANPFWVTSHAALAVLFNPLAPIYLYDQAVWAVLDLLAIALLLAGRRPAGVAGRPDTEPTFPAQ